MQHCYAISLKLVAILLLVTSCSPVSKSTLNKKFNSIETSLHNHTGFMLYDPVEKKKLYSFQSDRYFTPASNTKIFTFYTSLVLLGDSIPALQYTIHGDSLIFKGTGDPSFLYEETAQSNKVLQFLEQSDKQLFLYQDNLFTEPLGPGWAWDDYRYTYSVERSAFPIYGNYFSIQRNKSVLKIQPSLFAYNVSIADSTQRSSVIRDIGSNKISFYPGKIVQPKEQWKIPFKTSHELTATLLSDTLNKNVAIYKHHVRDSLNTLYSVPADSLYKVMMQESDNFISEQLLLVCSQVLSDSLKPEVAIRYMKKNYLNDLPDVPIWVDGSGLSRYNLFTPRSIVKLWEKIYQTVPHERLFPLLAIGGKTGTIKNYYKNDSLSNQPYIYGKTGTLSNNHSLSGYLVTKKGNTLIFSFMNNNYTASVREVRSAMEKILKDIYLNY